MPLSFWINWLDVYQNVLTKRRTTYGWSIIYEDRNIHNISSKIGTFYSERCTVNSNAGQEIDISGRSQYQRNTASLRAFTDYFMPLPRIIFYLFCERSLSA